MKTAVFFFFLRDVTLVESHQSFWGIFCSIFYLERGGISFLRKRLVSIYQTIQSITSQRDSNFEYDSCFEFPVDDLYSIMFYKIFQRNKCLVHSALFGNENLQYKLWKASRSMPWIKTVILSAFRFHKLRGISWVAERLLGYKGELSSMELVTKRKKKTRM